METGPIRRGNTQGRGVNLFLIEARRKGKTIPFFVIIFSRYYRFSLPGWMPWLMWVPLAMGIVSFLYARREAVVFMEKTLLRGIFWLGVAYFAICPRRCAENVRLIVQAAQWTAQGLPRATVGA